MSFIQKNISGFSTNEYSQLTLGRVITITLGKFLLDGKEDPNYASPADVGKITYEVIQNSGLGLSSNGANQIPAWPIFSFIKQYPVIGELILLVKGPSYEMNNDSGAQTMYYFPPYNVWNSPNHNVFPNMGEYSKFVLDSIKNSNSKSTSTQIPEYPKGYYFKESDIRRLRPFEGDTIIEGRFGQSIRFGSSSPYIKNESTWSDDKNIGPITIIRNGQGNFISISEFPDESIVENINTDGSSIYMTSGQNIILEDLNNFSFESYGIEQDLQIDRRIEKIENITNSTEATSPRKHDKS